MAWSPISAGDGRISHHILTKDGGSPFSLIGLVDGNLSLHLIDMADSSLHICTGSWHITDNANAHADFTPSAADLTAPGGPFGVARTYRAYPVVALLTGPVAMDPQILEVLNLP